MTVTVVDPVLKYTGNGTLSQFFWNWQMLEESVIEVRVDNNLVFNYTENSNNIIFDTPPSVGSDIWIFRRTEIWQPEEYARFRGFKANKTEMTVDRCTMLAQELNGGVVGSRDLFTTIRQDGIWINSER